MKPETWKTLAIIFMILFVIETLLLSWAFWYAGVEEQREIDCVYDICGEYPYGEYLGGVCGCYDRDILGELNLVKTKVMP